MPLNALVLGVLGLITHALLAAPSVSAEGILPYTDRNAVSEGKTVYRDYCASCHGADLAGEPNWRQPDAEGYLPAPPHDETGHTWHHRDEQLFMITKHGTASLVGGDYKTRMTGFGDQLDDDEILAVLAYIKSTWPRQIVLRHDRMNAAQDQ